MTLYHLFLNILYKNFYFGFQYKIDKKLKLDFIIKNLLI